MLLPEEDGGVDESSPPGQLDRLPHRRGRSEQLLTARLEAVHRVLIHRDSIGSSRRRPEDLRVNARAERPRR